MNFAEICASAYLIVGGVAFGLIWAVLIVSKRHDVKEQSVSYDSVDYSLFRERSTKPSRFHP
jgi:hypothetical protein